MQFHVLPNTYQYSIASHESKSSEYSEFLDREVCQSEYGSSDSDVDTFEEEFEDHIHKLASTIHSKFMSGISRYVSTVIVPNGFDGVDRTITEFDNLIERYPPTHWFIISSHRDHVHISHVSPNTNGACRCSWIQRSTMWVKFGKRRLRRITRAQSMSITDIANVLRYLSEGDRLVERVGGFSEVEGLFDRYKYLSVSNEKHFYKT